MVDQTIGNYRILKPIGGSDYTKAPLRIFASLTSHLVAEAFRGGAGITGPAVGVDVATRLDDVDHEPLETAAIDIRNVPQRDAADPALGSSRRR
jgi:hypothetical protein